MRLRGSLFLNEVPTTVSSSVRLWKIVMVIVNSRFVNKRHLRAKRRGQPYLLALGRLKGMSKGGPNPVATGSRLLEGEEQLLRWVSLGSRTESRIRKVRVRILEELRLEFLLESQIDDDRKA